MYIFENYGTAGEPDLLVAKWKSLVDHLQNIHAGFEPPYTRCAHPPDLVDRPWLEPGLFCAPYFMSLFY